MPNEITAAEHLRSAETLLAEPPTAGELFTEIQGRQVKAQHHLLLAQAAILRAQLADREQP